MTTDRAASHLNSLVQNRRGKWVPAIPEPIRVFWWKRCAFCPGSFITLRGYQGHYALEHILAS